MSGSTPAYTGRIEQAVYAIDKSQHVLMYSFEWEVSNAEVYARHGLDKAQVHQRVGDIIEEQLREHAGQMTKDDAQALASGDADYESVRTMALQISQHLDPIGVQLIDLDFDP